MLNECNCVFSGRRYFIVRFFNMDANLGYFPIDGRTSSLDLWNRGGKRQNEKITQEMPTEMEYHQICVTAASCSAAAAPHFYHTKRILSRLSFSRCCCFCCCCCCIW